MIDTFHPVWIAFVIILNAIFVMAEFVLIRIIKPKVELSDSDTDLGNRFLNKISANLNPYIFSAQLGISASTIVFGFLVLGAFTAFSNTYISKLGPQGEILDFLSLSIAIIISVLMHNLFAEYLPKLFAAGRVRAIAKLVSPFIYYFNFLTFPIRFLIRGIVTFFFNLLKIEVVPNLYLPIYDEDELKFILERSTKSGKIQTSENLLINRIFQFNDLTANDIITPRVEVLTVSADGDITEFLKLAEESKFSKFPIYSENKENIVGILNIKELVYVDHKSEDFDIMQLRRKHLSIHESMKLDVLLQKMKEKHIHIAIVFDEFGTFSGIVTMDDVLTALVGTITEDVTNEMIDVEYISEGIYKINPFMNLKDFNVLFNVDISSDSSPSLSGFIIAHNEGIPDESTQLILDDILFFDFKISGNKMLDFSVKVKPIHETTELLNMIKS